MTLVRALERADWAAVEDIYREGIEGGNATFETETPTWDAFDQAKARFGRLVAVDDAHAVVGWVAASPVSARAAYRGVVEHSVYVAARAQGRGIGAALVRAFIASAEMNGVWTIQSSVFPRTRHPSACTRASASARWADASGSRAPSWVRGPGSGATPC